MAEIKVGGRVRLYHTTDPFTKCRRGDMGTVKAIDGLGIVHTRFDNGEELSLLKNIDSFEGIEETLPVAKES